MVLSQNETTGALGYDPIVALYENPPAVTLNIRLEGETLVTTAYHRFWRPGDGWVMARDLKAGDRLGIPGGELEVSAMTGGGVQKVFNLDVAGNHSFFVGGHNILPAR